MVSVSVCLQTEFLAYQVYGVQKLPAEELNLLFNLPALTYQLHLAPERIASEVSVGGCRQVDGVLEAETLYDGCRTQVKEGTYPGGNLVLDVP